MRAEFLPYTIDEQLDVTAASTRVHVKVLACIGWGFCVADRGELLVNPSRSLFVPKYSSPVSQRGHLIS